MLESVTEAVVIGVVGAVFVAAVAGAAMKAGVVVPLRQLEASPKN